MAKRLISYLTVKDIINLTFVLKIFRNLILKQFDDIYHLNSGIASDRHWFSLPKQICFDLTQAIYNEEFFDVTLFNYHFDCEENYLNLLKDFRNLSLFSIFFTFPTMCKIM